MECIRKIYEIVCCVDRPLFPEPYKFNFKGGQQPQNLEEFENNYVRTAKYRWYDFFIKALLLQYTRVANVYFLFIGILVSIPIISPVNSATIWFPIALVLALSMIREGYEDYQRHLSDEQLNHEFHCMVFEKGSNQQSIGNNQSAAFASKQWASLKIGDIVRVQEDEFFPADLILLSSSEINGNAFIETSSLDGEKSLKVRKAYPATNKYNCEQLLLKFQGSWESDVPNKDLHRFSAKMVIEANQALAFEGDKQFLYRGAKLKNTKYVYGMVIYTGKNTKVMMNLNQSINKISQIERKVNYLLIVIFAVQFCSCLLAAILHGVFRQQHEQSYTYIDWYEGSVFFDSFLIFFSYFVLLSTFIPISLVITIQFVKVSQSYFINNDRLLYSHERQKGVIVKSVSLNEELGQIQYVFTDKTGTLTRNIMEFKVALIGNQQIGDFYGVDRYGSNETGLKIQGKNRSEQYTKNQKDKTSAFEAQNKQEYLKALSMAHEVLSEDRGSSEPRLYRGPSPDELALVEFARDMDYEFIDASQNVITVKINGKNQSFELLQVFSFTSDRKRMSIIVKDQDGSIKMYIKGADSVINSRLLSHQSIDISKKIDKYSSLGLRTLLIATRTFTEKEYQEFKQKVSKLQNGKQREKQYEDLISKMESDLVLLGGTAVLDKLQDYVPQTIKDLIKASIAQFIQTLDIKVWMLTGDKLETAENVGKSCNLIQKDFATVTLSTSSLPLNGQPQAFEKELEKKYSEVEQISSNGLKKALIIEGAVLASIIGNEQMEARFVETLQKCEVVVCCRMLPIQKAEVVSLIKSHTKKIVLSIGDGQNDVPMIRAANIGIGLYGEEGMGAVQASDYGLPEFRMLRRLMFVHGRWNYIRISEMILYFFYKNVIFTIPRLVFAFYNGYSAQRVFDDVYVGLYNAVFTAIPLAIRAVLEQDVNYVFERENRQKGIFPEHGEESAEKFIKDSELTNHPQVQNLTPGYAINKYFYRLFPKIYFVGQENCIFNIPVLIYWFSQALIVGVLVTIIAFEVIPTISIGSNGQNGDFWLTSLNLFSAFMLIVTLKLITRTKYWTWSLIFSIVFFSIGLYIGYMWFSNYIAILSDHILGTTERMYQNLKSCLFLIFCGCLILFIDGAAVTIDFHYGSYASKMRLAVNEEKQQDKEYLRHLSLPLSETVTSASKLTQPINRSYHQLEED